jgi:hypothetical protein
MLIPKQDIIEGMPIRWAFHCWLTPPESRWKFTEWRDYLLSFDEPSYEMIPVIFTDYRFRHDVQGFLCCNNASTLAGFIRFYIKCQVEYTQLIKETPRTGL